jgi:hypothetical protein
LGNVFDSTIGKVMNMATGQNNVPDPQQVPLDPATQGLITSSIKDAKRPATSFGADLNRGTSEAAEGFDPNGEIVRQKSPGLGGQSGFDALRGVYQSQAGAAIGRMKEKSQYEGRLQKYDRAQSVARVLLGQQQIQAQNYHMLTEAYNRAEVARAGFINSLFQGANTAIAISAGNSKGGGGGGSGGGINNVGSVGSTANGGSGSLGVNTSFGSMGGE